MYSTKLGSHFLGRFVGWSGWKEGDNFASSHFSYRNSPKSGSPISWNRMRGAVFYPPHGWLVVAGVVCPPYEKAKKVVDDIARGEKMSAAVGRTRARSGGLPAIVGGVTVERFWMDEDIFHLYSITSIIQHPQ
jgi:hypothetical protein